MSDTVAYILGRYPEDSETFIRREIEELRRLGVDVLVLSLRRPPKPSPEVFYRSRLLSLGSVFAVVSHLTGCLRALGVVAKLCTSPIEMLKALRNVLAAAEFTSRVRRDDISRVHAHFANMPATVGLMMVAMSGVEFSFTAHARDLYVRPTLLTEKVSAASVVTTCSEFNRKLLKGVLPDGLSGRVFTVYHGVDEDTFAPVDRAKYGVPLILAVGRLVEKKGFDVLVDACSLLRAEDLSFRCEIVGDGPLRERLQRRIEEAGLGDTVRLTGAQAQEALPHIYRDASVCVQPSVVASDGDHDGLPNVLLEAAGCGVPIISTPVGGIPELVRDSETGLLVPERDAEAIAAAVRRLLSEPELRRSVAKAAREEVERRFSQKENVRRLAEVLRLTASEVDAEAGSY